MVPQIGFAEFLVLGIVALVVVGPRDLPRLMRGLGELAGKARGLARDFRRSFEEMGRETELAELRKEISALKRGDVIKDAAGDPFRDIGDEIRGAEREMRAGGHAAAPAAPATPATSAPPAPEPTGSDKE